MNQQSEIEKITSIIGELPVFSFEFPKDVTKQYVSWDDLFDTWRKLDEELTRYKEKAELAGFKRGVEAVKSGKVK